MSISIALGLFLSAASGWSANLALDGEAKSWELNRALPKLNDASDHTYDYFDAGHLPADVGVEWNHPKLVGSVILRYFDARMVRHPEAARTQDGGRLEYWQDGAWRELNARRIGTQTASARYVFPPVRTRRIRFLMTEPPDPEARRAPDRLGIAICEFEAYEKPFFDVVESGGRLVESRHHPSYLTDYNEAPAGDNSYEIAGPLIIEPKQTRVFRDSIEATLVPSDLPHAAQPCRAVRETTHILLENGFLGVDIDLLRGAESQIQNRITGEITVLGSSAAEGPASAKLSGCEVRLTASRGGLQVVRQYALATGDHFYHKWISYRNTGERHAELRDITVSSLGLPGTVDLMAGQELTYPIYRTADGGIFEALEAVYWDHRGDALTYYPGVTLEPGATYVSEKAAIGIYINRGEHIAGWDRGLREWVIAYHSRISPLTKEWPEAYCEGWTADLSLKRFQEHPEQIEHFFRTARQLGIGYADTYDPSHQAIQMQDFVLRNFVNLAERFHVGTGWWNDFGADNSWNGTVIPRKPFACKMSPEAEEFYRQVVDSVRRHRLRAMHWADFFTVWPCNETGHGHLPGKYSIYAQGKRMLRFRDQLKEASPGILLGADGGFTNPQFVKYTDGRGNAWFVDGADKFSAMEQDIHIDRLVASRNRVYAYGAHITNLIPWARLLNWVNHFGYVSHLHDRAGFRYALLSALGLAPQLTYNDVPDEIPESDIAFTQHWFAWARENADVLRYGDKLFDRSVRFADIWQGDADSLSGFSHIRRDHGFVFLQNPTPVEQIAELRMALRGERFAVTEIYPSNSAQTIASGAVAHFHVPARQIMILQIVPGAAAERQASPAPARYIGGWSVEEHTPETATLRSRFTAPERWLRSTVGESEWSQNPWGFDKTYLVLLLKDESGEWNNSLISDSLKIGVRINGVERRVFPFQTKRYTIPGKTRCYFVEVNAPKNDVAVTLPISTGLVFQGAWLDVPE